MMDNNYKYMTQYHVSRLIELKKEMNENIKIIESFIGRNEELWKDKTTYLSWLPKEIFDIIFADNNDITPYELNWNHKLKGKLSDINYSKKMSDLQNYLYENTVCYMVYYDNHYRFDCVILDVKDLHVFSDNKYKIVKTTIKNTRNYDWNAIGQSLMHDNGCYFESGYYIKGNIDRDKFIELKSSNKKMKIYNTIYNEYQ